MNNPDIEQPDFIDRAPRNFRERLLANVRPQPAIPAVMVFFFSVLLPVVSQTQPEGFTDDGNWLAYVVAGGIVVSCSLAVAAGFCSVFPQAAWFILAWWCLGFTASSALPFYNQALLVLGMSAVIVIFGYQLWRVGTGKFLPTIREYLD